MGAQKSVVRFGVFEVDLAAGEVHKGGLKIKLQEQPFQVLTALIERPQEIVTREELQKRLWPDTVVDFDRGLNKTINRLREALGDDADHPQLIETVPLRGYRFLAPVESAREETQPPPSGRGASLWRRASFATAAGLVVVVALLALLYDRVKTSGHPIESIAVLPLENLSGDPSQEFFSDGMTDELIGELARIASLRVISRTSVMRYKRARRKSLPEIARELKADAIIEGTVAQTDRKIRINVQLVRAWDDRHLWSARYERDVADVLTLQSAVARAVAREIRINLTPQEQRVLERTRTVKREAYEASLKGSYFLHKGIPGVSKSIEWFTEARKMDPEYADAYAGLAEALIYAAIFGLRPSADAFSEARAAALKALEIDESNAPAHNALADVKKGYDWDLQGAEAEYQRALQLNPNHLLTRLWYAECLSRMGRHDEALQESARAVSLDPVSSISHTNRAMLLSRARRYDEAILESQQALDFEPERVNAYWWMGLSYAGKSEFSKSIACLTKAKEMSDRPLFVALLGYVYGRAGEGQKSRRVLEELKVRSAQEYVSPIDFAIVHAGLGDANSMFHWLDVAYQAHSARIHELSWLYFDSFRLDPRYIDLKRRIGLPLP